MIDARSVEDIANRYGIKNSDELRRAIERYQRAAEKRHPSSAETTDKETRLRVAAEKMHTALKEADSYIAITLALAGLDEPAETIARLRRDVSELRDALITSHTNTAKDKGGARIDAPLVNLLLDLKELYEESGKPVRVSKTIRKDGSVTWGRFIAFASECCALADADDRQTERIAKTWERMKERLRSYQKTKQKNTP